MEKQNKEEQINQQAEIEAGINRDIFGFEIDPYGIQEEINKVRAEYQESGE